MVTIFFYLEATLRGKRFCTFSCRQSHDEGAYGEGDTGTEDGGATSELARQVTSHKGESEGGKDCRGDNQLVPEVGQVEFLIAKYAFDRFSTNTRH